MPNYNFWDTNRFEYLTVSMSEDQKKDFMNNNPHLREIPPEPEAKKNAKLHLL